MENSKIEELKDLPKDAIPSDFKTAEERKQFAEELSELIFQYSELSELNLLNLQGVERLHKRIGQAGKLASSIGMIISRIEDMFMDLFDEVITDEELAKLFKKMNIYSGDCTNESQYWDKTGGSKVLVKKLLEQDCKYLRGSRYR